MRGEGERGRFYILDWGIGRLGQLLTFNYQLSTINYQLSTILKTNEW